MSPVSPRDDGSATDRYLALVPAAIVVAALYFGRPVLLPLAVSVLFAFALAPLVGWLRRTGLGRILSVLLATAVALSLTAAIAIFITTRTVELAGELPRYQTNLIEKIRSIRGTTISGGAVERATNLLETLRDQLVTEKAPARPETGAVRPPGETPVQVQIQEPDAQPIELAASLVWSMLGFVVAAGIVVIFVIFILLYKEDIRDRFIRLAGSSDIQKAALLLDEGAERLGHYLLAQTAINAGFGCLIGAGLWVIGLPNPLLWGLIAFVLRFIPYVGVPLSGFLPVMLALSVDSGWSMAIATIGLFITAQLIFEQGFEPWLFGRRMGLSPLAIIVAATFWTWLWGPIGLLLSTPLTMCLVVLGRHVEHLQFLDVLLGDRAPLSAEESLYIRLLGEDADQAAADAESFLKEHTVCRYYDDVVLKALGIGDTDLRRGALEYERALKIKESTRALVQNVADGHGENGETAREHRGSVICIGGRGPLDEAAAMLLTGLLEDAEIRAQLVPARDISEAELHDGTDAKIIAVCVCYLDPANSARAPYLLKRIRRRVPGATVIAALFDSNQAPPGLKGFRVVTSLDGAVQAITALVDAGDAPADKRVSARAENALESERT